MAHSPGFRLGLAVTDLHKAGPKPHTGTGCERRNNAGFPVAERNRSTRAEHGFGVRIGRPRLRGPRRADFPPRALARELPSAPGVVPVGRYPSPQGGGAM